jgi:hyperosmotically inducible protein
MNRKPLHQALTVLLAAGCIGTTVPAAAAQTDAMAGTEFERLDANRDGYISPDEARKIRGFDKAFREADDNRDGRLDASEFVKAQSVHERIRAGNYVDDSLLTAKVKAALLKDSATSVFAVSVETHKGIVLLSGFVDNESQARRAAEIASRVEGVVDVKNGLTVKS